MRLYLTLFIQFFGLLLVSRAYAVEEDSLSIAQAIYLQTDKPYYVAGEDVLLSAIIIDSKTEKISTLSEQLHILLTDKKGQEIERFRVKLKQGIGNLSIPLSDELRTGTYQIVAFTKLMLQESRKKYKSLALTIIHPEEPILPTENTTHKVSFYPEGGSIVSNALNNIICEVNGADKILEGFVVDNNRDTVAIIKPKFSGFAQMLLFAKPESSYSAILKVKDKVLTVPLPAINDNGIALRTSIVADSLIVTLNYGGLLMNKELKFLIQQNEEILVGTKLMVNQKTAQLKLPSAALKPGLNQIAILSDNNQLISERLVFSEFEEKTLLDVQLNNQRIKPRSHQKLSLSNNRQGNEFTNTHVVLSIRDEALYPQRFQQNIQRELEIYDKINLNSVNYELDSLLMAKDNMQDFLITKRLLKNTIEDIFESPTAKQENLIESKQNITIIGRAYYTDSKIPLRDQNMFCSIISKDPQFLVLKTNENGYFQLRTRPFYGNAEIVLKAKEANEQLSNIAYTLFQPRPEVIEEVASSKFTPSQKIVNDLLLFHKENQFIDRVYFPDQIKESVNRNQIELSTFFSEYGFERNYLEYQTMRTFEELVKEILPAVFVRKNGYESTILVRKFERKKFDRKNKQMLEPIGDNPLILIDGLPALSQDRLLNFNPAKIHWIRTVNEELYLNGDFFDGVIEVSTLDGNYYQDHNTNHQVFNIRGFEDSGFMQDDKLDLLRETENLPDFRATLYWDADLHFSNDAFEGLYFYSSDRVGEYTINIQGFSNNGLIDVSKSFEIINPN